MRIIKLADGREEWNFPENRGLPVSAYSEVQSPVRGDADVQFVRVKMVVGEKIEITRREVPRALQPAQLFDGADKLF